MLDTETKRRIDNARDILVGKVPDPKSQVEQITLALIYKFMDDMDKQSEEWGGKASFFTGEFTKYSWSSIFDPKLGGYELLNLYSEALLKMNQNPNIPVLFREIFKNAYLPYRDPETLKSFLKEINGFCYDHSERLGDAYEYLLLVLGSQGDAGQFRTPRHIIDFVVKVLDPKKNETILDPACGTAGFLISSFKHIMEENTKDTYGDQLTPEERNRLIKNFTGYDISPDMVRISLVNMYLHGFADPKIHEYDTLTSEERWNDTADVILANPPFMTPKGGIRPHKRFSIQANRSEVLFVDYIAEHLNNNGRAGIIVPEGIIFQSGNAYKALRKMLVENYLYAVVSLPAGVFNPYSGVKTSILFMDKALAKKADSILFVKIDNDGYDLGAQRREINGSNLPEALKAIQTYKEFLFNTNITNKELSSRATIISKEKIAESGNFDLTGDRYKDRNHIVSEFPLVKIGKVCEIIGGGTPSRQNEDYWNAGTIKWISSKYISENNRVTGYELITEKALNESSSRIAPKDSTILITRVSVGKYAFADDDYAINQDLTALIPDKSVEAKYLFMVASHLSKLIEQNAQGIGVRGVTRDFVSNLIVPLPPIEVQREIVAEIEGYQKIIDGAKQVVENYKPIFKINPEWEFVELGSVTEKITDGSHFSPQTVPEGYPYITVRDIVNDKVNFYDCKFISKNDYLELKKNNCQPFKGDLLFSKDGTVGKVAFVDFEKEFVILSSLAIIRPDKDKIYPEFLKNILQSDNFINQAIENKTGVAIKRIVLKTLKTIKIPLPPIETQKEIAYQIQVEESIIEANRNLIKIFEQKIKDKIGEVWGKQYES